MEHSNADRMLNEVELATVSGGTGIDAALERFAAANAGRNDASNDALSAYAASLKFPPTGRTGRK